MLEPDRRRAMLSAACALSRQAVRIEPIRAGLELARQLIAGASGEVALSTQEAGASLPVPALCLIETTANRAWMSPAEALG